LTNFGTTVYPEALCPLAEPLPPDSTGAVGVESAGLMTEPTICLLEEEGGLTRKAIKRRQQLRRVPSRTHLSILPAEAALRFQVLTDSTDGSSAANSWTSDAVRLAEGPANKNRLRLNKDPKAISNPYIRQKKSDAHLSQYAPRAHLQAMEAYSDNFRD
jgi:hypothetical protein